MSGFSVITPDWPAPASVHACSTTRGGGYSQSPWDSLNLGDHVGDDPAAVAANRERVRHALALPAAPLWLNQVHSTRVVCAAPGIRLVDADGSLTDQPGVVCAVMTADCLPVLLCNRQGTRVAALHAGWRGLLNGILEVGIDAMPGPVGQLLAWIGPGIGPQAFEVGDEVREAFMRTDPAANAAFVRHRERWLADLPALARLRLRSVGVNAIFGGDECTYRDSQRFFSYRRDGQTGRQASLIWFG